MAGGLFCDFLVFLVDLLQGIVDLGFGWVSLIGVQPPNLNTSLNLGSLFGCNL